MTDLAPDLTRDLEDLIAGLVLDDEEFDADTELLLEGLVDSMGVVQIVQWLEERVGIEIDPADVVIDNFGSIRAIAAFVERASGAGASAQDP